MDLLYTTLTPKLRADLEAIGADIEDASDFIHEERSSIHVDKSKKQEYLAILKKHGVLQHSLSYLSNR